MLPNGEALHWDVHFSCTLGGTLLHTVPQVQKLGLILTSGGRYHMRVVADRVDRFLWKNGCRYKLRLRKMRSKVQFRILHVWNSAIGSSGRIIRAGVISGHSWRLAAQRKGQTIFNNAEDDLRLH